MPYPFPRRSEVPILEKQGFDDLIDFLDREFQKFPDHRAGNALRYDLANVLKNAFAMFSLKAPSLIDFKKRTEPERNNLLSIYQIRGAIPCDNRVPYR